MFLEGDKGRDHFVLLCGRKLIMFEFEQEGSEKRRKESQLYSIPVVVAHG